MSIAVDKNTSKAHPNKTLGAVETSPKTSNEYVLEMSERNMNTICYCKLLFCIFVVSVSKLPFTQQQKIYMLLRIFNQIIKGKRANNFWFDILFYYL